MHHLRTRRKPTYRSTICALAMLATQDIEEPYSKNLLTGARQRAEALGYLFRLLAVEDSPSAGKALGRSLHYQGVEGVLIPPSVTTGDFREFMNWRWFSVVAATYSVLAPEFHRVVPHQFGNALLLCQRLAKLGYRRIGLVLPSHQDLRVHHGFSAAVVWQNTLGGTEFVRPLIHESFQPELVRSWFASERPDVIIAGGPEQCRAIATALGVRIPGRIGFAATACFQDLSYSGIHERPAEIGRAAIDLLHAKILNHEKGIPEVPTATMVKGLWNSGRTTRNQKRRRK